MSTPRPSEASGEAPQPGAAFEVVEPTVLDEVTIDDYYEHAPCGYLTLLPDGRILRVNQTFLDWTANSREALMDGRRFTDLLTMGGRVYFETHCTPLLLVEGTVREIALEVLCADGHRLPVLLGAEARLTPDGTSVIRATLFDASHRRAYERQILAALDEAQTARAEAEAEVAKARTAAAPRGSDISGLPNRRWWDALLRAEIEIARADGTPLVLVAVEIAGFERYGQVQGHDAADRLLLQVADVWRRAGHDLVARHDGEAFGTPLRGMRLADAAQLVRRLRRGSGAGTEFFAGIAEWDGLETAAQLTVRAEAELAADRGAHSA